MGEATANAATEAENGGFSGLFVAPTAKELDEILESYEVLELIGQGGMGAVYKARQPRLDRNVAIKLLPAFAKGASDEHGERFEREARAMAQLNHPNVVTVHDFGETDVGHRYIVMEYVDGSDLHSLIQTKKLTPKHALAWVPQICSALEYAHSKNIVHRDVKPANILISKDGEVKVGDFGLAKLLGQKFKNSITQTRTSMGTPDYAAPEALEEGAEADRRADVYSLGVLFYELLTGQVPRGAWRPPSAFADVDVRIDQIVVKAMQPDPNHRYQSVGEILQALADLRSEPKSKAPSVPKVAAVKPKTLLTGLVQLPSKKELEQLVSQKATRADRRTGSRVRSAARSASGKSNKMSAFAVAGIALGGVFLVVGLILLIAGPESKAKNDPPPVVITPPDPKPPDPENPIVEPGPEVLPKPEPPGPGPEPGPALQVIGPGDGWRSLLADIDPAAGAGRWSQPTGGQLRLVEPLPKPRHGWMPFPIVAGPAYELEVSLKPSEIEPIAIHLPVGPSSSVLFVLGDAGEGTAWAGLNQVDGRDAFDERNPTRTELNFEPGESIDLAFRVVGRGRKAGIMVQRDGKSILRWSGRSEQLRLRSGWKGLGGRRVAIGAQTPMLIERARIRALPRFVDIPKMPIEPPDESRPWVDALAVLDLEKSTVAGVWGLENRALRMTEAADSGVRPRFELPLVPLSGYEIEFRFEMETDGDLVFLLPVAGERYAPLHLAASGDTSGLDLANSGISAVGNPTAMPSPVEAGKNHLGMIQVRRTLGEEVRIAMTIDGTPVFNWSGAADELPTDTDWPVRDKTRISIGATAKVRLEMLQIRGVDPSSIPEKPMTPPELEGVKLRLTELEGKFQEEMATSVEPVFKTRMAALTEQYNGSLNSLILKAKTDGDIGLQVAAEREQETIVREGGAVPDEDPPEFPPDLKARRDVYRGLKAGHVAERAGLALPVYRDYSKALEMLIAEYVTLENETAVMFIAKKKEEIDAEIEQLLKQSSPAAEPETPEPAPAVSGGPAVLQRPVFPYERPTDRGEVVVFKRALDAVPANPQIGEIPSGLSTTVVAIAGGPDVALALKSNGRMEIWGAFSADPPEEITGMTRVTKMVVSHDADEFHFAALNEDGELKIFTAGWAEDTLTTFLNQAQSITEPVNLCVVPKGGLAVKSDGGLGYWGPLGSPGGENVKFERIVNIAAGPGIVAAVQEDGSVLAIGPGAGNLAESVPKARDIAIGTHAETGVVVLLPDRKALAGGDFSKHQEQLREVTGIQKIVAGYDAFAVQTADGEWRFFGDNLDPAFCAEQARGCSDIVIGRDFVVGLKKD